MNIVIHEILSIILFYTCFCRAVKTDETTRFSILVAFWFMSAASVISMFAPLVIPNYQPDFVTLTLLFAIVLVQVVASYHWRHGVPDAFTGEHHV